MKEPGQMAYEAWAGTVLGNVFRKFSDLLPKHQKYWARVEAAVRADERERCAKMAEEKYADARYSQQPDYWYAGNFIAAAIRAAGGQSEG